MSFGNFPAQVDGGYYGQLKCKCGSDYLHQDNVTIFKRAEDADITTVIAQDGHDVQATEFPSQDTCNPSPRRHGMLIEFDCEDCGQDGTKQRLAIFQHKGHTFMEWVD
jgi:hypothetical protein